MSRSVRSLIVVVLGGAVLVFAAQKITQLPDYRTPKDFPEYWAAGLLNLRGEDPYDPAFLLTEQRKIDPNRDEALMMWNPPPALALYMPLAWLPFRLAALLWVGVQLLAVLAACDVLGREHLGRAWGDECGGPGVSRGFKTDGGSGTVDHEGETSPRPTPHVPRWLAPLAGFLFVGTWWLVAFGQNTGLILLGLAGFLYFTRRDHPLAAGACAALTALKPHLLLGFGILLIAGASNRKGRLTLLAGFGAIAIALGLVLVVNPEVIGQYLHATRDPGPHAQPLRAWAVPVMAYWLRMYLDPDCFWIQFLPCVLSCAVLVAWRFRSKEWDWGRNLPIVVAASVLSAPYGWIFDLPVLLVPVVWAMSRGAATGRWAIVALMLVGQVVVLTVSLAKAGALHANWWVAPSVLLLCVPALAVKPVRPRILALGET